MTNSDDLVEAMEIMARAKVIAVSLLGQRA